MNCFMWNFDIESNSDCCCFLVNTGLNIRCKISKGRVLQQSYGHMHSSRSIILWNCSLQQRRDHEWIHCFQQPLSPLQQLWVYKKGMYEYEFFFYFPLRMKHNFTNEDIVYYLSTAVVCYFIFLYSLRIMFAK